jgi:hypothetical protein
MGFSHIPGFSIALQAPPPLSGLAENGSLLFYTYPTSKMGIQHQASRVYVKAIYFWDSRLHSLVQCHVIFFVQ